MITDKTREQINEAALGICEWQPREVPDEALTILYKIVLVYGKDVGPMKEGRDFLNKLGIDV